MTYMSELRSSLVDAARRQHASGQHASGQHASGQHASTQQAPAQQAASARRPRERATAGSIWWRSVHGGRAVLVSLALGLTSTAVGAVQVGAPLGPEPQLSSRVTGTAGSAQPGEPSP
jgi:hypothetical protein